MKKSIHNQDIFTKALALHRRYRGKLEVCGKIPFREKKDLALIYTPGVGGVSSFVAKHPESVREYTIKGNAVAVVSDGSAVLGLGNIGAYGSIPVLEGKCFLFKHFAGIDAFPIALATENTEEIIAAVKAIAPIFGGINLEDISAPRCFEIEERLKKELDIPVMHDDQHGTAIIVLAALLNAARVTRKDFKKLRVVIQGAGPAGTAVARLLIQAGVRDIVLTDSHGVIFRGRKNLLPYKADLARRTNPRGVRGEIQNALRGADVLIGVSRGNTIAASDVMFMAPRQIVFALSNPIPEIIPDEAKRGGAFVVATGRSDFPNQINNSLAFPGIFRGALDRRVPKITDTMKLRAARALAGLVPRPTASKIIPSMFDPRVMKTVARSIR